MVGKELMTHAATELDMGNGYAPIIIAIIEAIIPCLTISLVERDISFKDK